MDISKYKDKGFVGLANLGNTCFLNSCVQVLNHTYEFHSVLDDAVQINHNCIDITILKEWIELRDLMWSGTGTLSPNKFIYHVQQIARQKDRDIFTGWVQNDITEFLLFMIDCIHNSIARKISLKINGTPKNSTDQLAITCYKLLETIYTKEYSEIMDLFYGIYVTMITDPISAKVHSMKPEHFFVLDLQIFTGNRAFSNLYECFDLFTSPELMAGENAWFNEKTQQKEDILRGVTFWSFPKILVLTLKRFSPDGTQKLNHLIQFPLENLDLSKYVKGYHPESYKYDLFGVCNHMGGVSGGHYTAFVKNVSGQWIHYNDSAIEVIQNPASIVSPMAYCLFYRKK
jgi:ubiquitin C-terminal hydrolase